jgi:hypothetical protein
MTTYIGGARLPAISQEFLDAVDAAFPAPVVMPGMDKDTAMYNAGARQVVDWIKHHASVKNTPDAVAVQQAIVRYGS